MMLTIIIILLAIFSMTAFAASTSVAIPDAKGSPGSEATVPVNISGLSNAGALSIGITYDSAIISIGRVEKGELAKNSLFDANMSRPGILVIGVVNADGIDGSGRIATIIFDVVGKLGDTSDMTLERVAFNDADTYVDIQVDMKSGTFTVAEKSGMLLSWTVIGIIIAAVVVIAVATVLVMRRRKAKAIA
jgi:hypothetical protein